MHEELFAAMRQSVIDGDPDEVRVLAQRALALGIDPLEAINRGFVPGVTHVGEQFGLGEMFLPDLVLGGEAMKAAVAVLEPELARRGAQRESLGTVVLGTVRGDIHEIGKTLVHYKHFKENAKRAPISLIAKKGLEKYLKENKARLRP